MSSKSGIIYAVVARNDVVLAEFSTASGNFTAVTRKVLAKIPAGDSRQAYTYDRMVRDTFVAARARSARSIAVAKPLS